MPFNNGEVQNSEGGEQPRQDQSEEEEEEEEPQEGINVKAMPRMLQSVESISGFQGWLLALSMIGAPLANEKVMEALMSNTSLMLGGSIGGSIAVVELIKAFKDLSFQQQQLDQNTAIHKKELQESKKQHKEEINLSNKLFVEDYMNANRFHLDAWKKSKHLHDQDLEREAEQHLQDLTTQLRESQKEADRDLWEQQNTEKQNTMTVTALLLTGAFALTVEGKLPAETYGLWIIPWIPLADLYYGFLAFSLSLLFISILAGMAAVQRMSKFMLSRTSKQQETLRELRKIAHEQLLQLHDSEDKMRKKKEEDKKDNNNEGSNNDNDNNNEGSNNDNDNNNEGSNNDNDNNNERQQSERQQEQEEQENMAGAKVAQVEKTKLNSDHKSITDMLKKARREFSKRLWEQPVLVSNWRALGAGLYVVNFDEWYHYDMVSSLSSLNVLFFILGTVCLLISMGLYTEAHRRWDENNENDDDDNDDSRSAFIFWIIILFAIGFLFVIIYSSKYYSLPSWKTSFVNPPTTKAKIDYGTKVEVFDYYDPVTKDPSIHNKRLGICLKRCHGSNEATSSSSTTPGPPPSLLHSPSSVFPSPEPEYDAWKVLLLKSHYPPYFLEEIEIIIPIKNLKIPNVKSIKNSTSSNHYSYNKKDYHDVNVDPEEKAYLMTVNVTDMQDIKKKLFKKIDFDNSGSIDMNEICSMLLRFDPPSIPYATKKEETKADTIACCRCPSVPSIVAPMSTPADGVDGGAGDVADGANRLPVLASSTNDVVFTYKQLVDTKKSIENAMDAHDMLRQYPMLQEAILDLVEKLLSHEPNFIKLKYKNTKLANSYLSFILKLVHHSLSQIRNNVPILDMNVKLSYIEKWMDYYHYRQIFNKVSDDKWESEAFITTSEWDRTLDHIFLEKFF